ncbi:MAG: gluconate 2-dehydrogenase subunit 3 family protein [Gemmatimonadota bacterium]|jgi:hypothetical protein
MDRRTALKLAATVPVAGGFTWTACEVDDASRAATAAGAAGGSRVPQFFDEHEWRTVNVLVDRIIPADERSGSASDAGVPAFMDFMMTDVPDRQTAMRGGLRWIDNQCLERFGNRFVDCDEVQQAALLDDIAWPARAKPEHSQGVAFFNSFRDLTATGFWSSRMGIDDLQYTGNVPVPEWEGCPPEALVKLGVRYEA